MEAVQILAIGAHPDDIDIGSAGLLLKEGARGRALGALDLTRGERASRGTIQDRLGEADEAAGLLGLRWRHQLELPDGELRDGPAERRALVEILRAARPEVLIGPSADDPHPDHRAAAALVAATWFLAGVAGFAPELGAAHRPLRRLEMVVRPGRRPDLLVPIDAVWDRKLAVLRCFRSQLIDDAPHRHGLARPLEEVDVVARTFGALAGCERAEGFVAPDGWVTSGVIEGQRTPEQASGSDPQGL
ncbi:MAG: bacillithiol biosynthesis deacetylase BshB1 [Planctomycetota bacterium]